MKILNLTKTCWMCPSQWEGTLEDGKMVYIRYRWGHLTITTSKEPSNDIQDAVDGEMLLELQVGDDFCGNMENEDMLSYLKDIGIEYEGEINGCE